MITITITSASGGEFHQVFCQWFSLTTVISYWNPYIWLAESKFVSEKHWQNAWWNAPQIFNYNYNDNYFAINVNYNYNNYFCQL